MSKEYILLDIRNIGGELSLLNSRAIKTSESTLEQIQLHINTYINGMLNGDEDIRDINTYKEVFDSSSSIEWEYYRYIANENGDSRCMGVLK
jgi:hypothetical protein